MNRLLLSALALVLASVMALPPAAVAESSRLADIRVVKDETGQRIQIDGEDFMVFGMNWDYFPIGTNYTYSLWTQPDEFIQAALDYECSLMKAMGVNTIRVYNGIQPKWIEYIYERYGIWTILNHPMLRYGYNLHGSWIPAERIDYSNQELRDAVTAEILALVDEMKDTRGLLMWMLGNENNYQLSWRSTEIEALPEGERHAARAKHLYTLYEDVASAIKKVDDRRLITMANGDLQYIDLMVEHVRSIDVFGTNVYRGISARDLYQVVSDKLDLPIMYAEFGCDAWDARRMREDQTTQARYLLGQWQEIYEQSAGKGRVGNAVGGLTFQWSDGWWKYLQTERLDIQDTHASWPNGGYPDYVEGSNNMNEEWWGIMAKGQPDSEGFFELYPRAAYYALQAAYELDPYAPTTDLETIRAHFGDISPVVATLAARGDTAALGSGGGGGAGGVRVKGVRMEFETYNTGTKNSSLEAEGFDRLQSFYIDVEAKPAGNVYGNVSVNVLGNVPNNPIDEIFYENRGRSPRFLTQVKNEFVPGQQDTVLTTVPDHRRVEVYQASFNWDDDYFSMKGFYRTGRAHWVYEGDFFGFYPEAFYGDNVDIYNGVAPVGVEVHGKRRFEGLKFAYGTELWWGANPNFVVKYRRPYVGYTWTAMYQEDFADRPGEAVTSSAIPQRENQRASLVMEGPLGPFDMQLGGIWSGSVEVGRRFNGARRSGDSYEIYSDEIRDLDTFGGKIKLNWSKGRWNWYGLGAIQGLVAKSGYNNALNFTGWALRETGDGNTRHLTTGATMQVGHWQFGPNFLWQKPFEDPIPRELLLTPLRFEVPLATGLAARNFLDSPFAVYGNRETIGTELVLTYDSTPATWFWQWDNDIREDAPLAASMRFTFRHQPTTQDAGVFVSSGGNLFSFPGAPEAKDLWELSLRVVSSLGSRSRVVVNAYGGPAQPKGSAFETAENAPIINRTIDRFGIDARYVRNSLSVAGGFKKNDWGPYDFHRDFNLTYPEQYSADVSYSLGVPRWFADAPQTRVGLRATYRTLDAFSNRYDPVPVFDQDEDDDGYEWELRTYVHLSM